MTVDEIINLFNEVFKMPFSYLFSANKRVYWLYLVTSFILAFYVYKRTKVKGSFFNYVFNLKTWLGKSALVDYAFIFFNGLVKVIVIAPFLFLALYLTKNINEFLVSSFGVIQYDFSVITIVVSYTLIIVVVDDFASFLIHYLMHKIPLLWEFHKIHHSATALNPFTQYRIHPIELIINNLRGLVVKGVITGVFLYLANGQVSLLTFFGINIFNFLFFFWGANLRHSHVKLKYFNFLEYIIISPYQHQIHHSNNPKLYDTNMGSRLAIWDWLFGTLVLSESVKKLRFGLGGEEDKKYKTFLQNLISPFTNIIKKK
ncbi:MAG: sterol desaturase family protein [Flavobacteriales bacterium]|nr:sterol desaturase family protein [Flavobacteriales bacterium]MCB9363266.1 sterol desaturase family protein [Flavobacteriales bacterium]